MTDVIEYGRRSTLSMTNMNTDYKRKDGSKLYNIVENDFATIATTKWKLAFTNRVYNFSGGDKMNTLPKLSLFSVISDICPLITLCDTPDL